MSSLKEAGIIMISQGKSGITLAKDLSDITFYDVYRAVDPIDEEGLFHFHENPNMNCPVGRNIHLAMDDKLREIQTGMEDQMKKITIADVAAEIHKAVK
jgi:DNA-binding IscR family transcriptional regulator